MKIFGKENAPAQPTSTDTSQSFEDGGSRPESVQDILNDLNQSYTSDSTQATNSKSETSLPNYVFPNRQKTKKCENEKDVVMDSKDNSRRKKMLKLKRTIIQKRTL